MNKDVALLIGLIALTGIFAILSVGKNDTYHDHVFIVTKVNQCYNFETDSPVDKFRTHCEVILKNGDHVNINGIVVPGDKLYKRCKIQKNKDLCWDKWYQIPYYEKSHEEATKNAIAQN